MKQFGTFLGSSLLLLGVSICSANQAAHPPLLFDEDDLSALRNHVQSGWMADAFAVMKKQADILRMFRLSRRCRTIFCGR